jgi:excinuclease ABC subunit B
MANVIARLNKPTLVLAHNKTLAAQLYSEFKEFFPNNAVEYFVSYYDYYQPEAYVPSSDTYIEKDSSINDEIDKLRHSATFSLLERKDVVIVASVSCIYGLGDPVEYKELSLSLRPGMRIDRDFVIKKLVELQYLRNEMDFDRSTFRVRGDILEVCPAYSTDIGYRIEFFGDEIDRISAINTLTGDIISKEKHLGIFPASHYVTGREKLNMAIRSIQEELDRRVEELRYEGKLLEAQRIEQRTNYDIEILREMGFCSGIENYSRHLSQRPSGSTPYTLLDFFPDNYLIIADESHVSLPQVRGMYAGDRSRKSTLIDFGFRLPSALDNRPLQFDEFEKKINQILFVSATPADYELKRSSQIVEQIIRPTGLLDPIIEIKPINGQIDSLIFEINKTIEQNFKVLVTTLTKRMAEDLTNYLKEAGIKVAYLHSDIDTLQRLQIIKELRTGVYDVIIGINLLREGLDIPETALVAILDADKEGFLRSTTSMIQTIGRAARNSNGRVIMYADVYTNSMQMAITETNRRRKIQENYNKQHNITPMTIKKKIHDVIKATLNDDIKKGLDKAPESMSNKEINEQIKILSKKMIQAALELNFERAAELRDSITHLKKYID